MSAQSHNQTPLLLLIIGFGCIAVTFAQSLAVPTRQLLAPSTRFAESFESFDGDDYDEDMQRTREQLRQVLGEQLNSAVAPLVPQDRLVAQVSLVPLAAATLGVLSRRQPAIVAPRSGAEAAARFADEEDFSEEYSEEVDATPETETVAAQLQQQQYNPYRDNFNDLNEDGSYIFGYALPNGVRRWERVFYSEQQQGRVVEGFYAQPRQVSHGSNIEYELRCYRADSHGYHPFSVEYLQEPPTVRRNELPNVSCFNFTK